MKIAILGDIHGNIEALKVAYEIAMESGPDKIFHLGDLGGYAPFVNEVVDFLMEHNIPGVQGNYDEAVASDREHCGCKYEDDFQAKMAHISFEWTKSHTNQKAKEYMKNLPFQIDLLAEGKKVSIFHATPTKNNLYWYEERPDKFFLLMSEKAKADVMIYGHTHIPYFKKINEKYFINAGSVGKPKDEDPRTCVCLIEIGQDSVRAEFIRKKYDIKKVVDAIIERGLPPYFAQKLIQAK
ncbi:metallophosphoesterase family protein [Thermodesulfovibrio sp. TK110]